MIIEKLEVKLLPDVGDIVESVNSGNFYLIAKSTTDEMYNYIELGTCTYTNGYSASIKKLITYLIGNGEYIIHKSNNITLKINN